MDFSSPALNECPYPDGHVPGYSQAEELQEGNLAVNEVIGTQEVKGEGQLFSSVVLPSVGQQRWAGPLIHLLILTELIS